MVVSSNLSLIKVLGNRHMQARVMNPRSCRKVHDYTMYNICERLLEFLYMYLHFSGHVFSSFCELHVFHRIILTFSMVIWYSIYFYEAFHLVQVCLL